MHACRHKVALFAQGEGYTSSKQRLLACGSLPVFLAHDAMDSYYGRWCVGWGRVRGLVRWGCTSHSLRRSVPQPRITVHIDGAPPDPGLFHFIPVLIQHQR